MKTVIRYDHRWGEHVANVAVMAENQGLHKKNCLCFADCAFFKPGEPNNCPIAQALYDICVANDVVTPVWECAMYKESE